jgi:hypothetical protein
MILCGGSHEGSLLSYGFWLDGFIRSRLAGHLHTVLVNIPSCIWCYGVAMFVFEPPWVTAIIFVWSWARVWFWFLHSWLWWLLCQDAFFRVGFYYMALRFYQHYSVFWENHQGYTHACSHDYYLPVRSLFSSVHSLSYLV